MNTSFVAICNPISGRCSSLPRVLRLRQALRAAGADLQIHSTTHAGHATTLASETATDTRAIIVVGGDGTLCEVANGLRGRETPVALLPAGTENLLARSLGLPADVHEATAALMSLCVRQRDAAEVNGRIFLAVAGVGFDAECVERLCRKRSGHIVHTSYFVPIWRTFFEHRFPRLRIVADGALAFEGPGLIVFGLVNRYAVGLPVLPGADPTDGLLDIAIFPCRSRRQLLRCAVSVSLAQARQDAIHLRCTNLIISSTRPAWTQLDGERGPATPIECRSLPGYFRYVVNSNNPRCDGTSS